MLRYFALLLHEEERKIVGLLSVVGIYDEDPASARFSTSISTKSDSTVIRYLL